MAYDQIFDAGSTSKLVEFPIRSSTTGQLLTGKLFSDVTIEAFREGAAEKITVSPVTMTLGTWVSGGFVETDVAGVYQFGVPNALLAVGAKAVTVKFVIATAIDKTFRVLLNPPVNATQIEGTAAKEAINAEADTALTDYGANTVAPDPAGTGAAVVLALATAHGSGSWETATGFYTGTPPTADAIGTDAASKILATPSQKLVTNASGQVESSNMRGTDGAYTGTPPSADAIGTDAASKILVTPTNKLATNDSGEVTPTVASKTGYALSADGIAAMLDLANGIESGLTPRQALRAISAALAGILAGADGTTITLKAAGAAADGTTRITATVDSDGNRSAITLNL